MDLRYNLGTAEEEDVDQLLEQFEEESLLTLQLGSHRNAGGFADVMPSYLQDEAGGLDRELASRLAALKAPSASDSRTPPEETSSLNAKESATREDKQGGKQATENKADESQIEDAELDPVEVASLGKELARRLHKLRVKESASKAGQSIDVVAPTDKLLNDQKKYPLLSSEEKAKRDSKGRTLEQKSLSDRGESKAGMPFIDLSRGTKLQQPSQEDPERPRSNLFAGLFGQKKRPPTKKPREASIGRPEDAERRAQSLLAGVSDGASSHRKGDVSHSLAAPQSALYRDIKGATSNPDQAYDGVLQDERKEMSEVEALLAALHEDVRIRKSRQSAAGFTNLEDSESEQSDLDSDLSEEAVDRHAKEVTEWSKDFARLEEAGSRRERGASETSKSSRHRRRSSSGDDGTDSEEDDASSSGEDTPRSRTKKG